MYYILNVQHVKCTTYQMCDILNVPETKCTTTY